MKKFTVLFFVIILMSSSLLHPQQGWFQQNSGSTDNFNTVFFLNDQTGFASGGLIIYKTTNGGTNWLPKVLSDTSAIYSIRFLNSTTGYACGGRYIDQYTTYQLLFKTTNTGENWIKIYQSSGLMTSEYYLDVFPVDSLIYLARGGTDGISSVGSLYRSMNSGTNFTNTNAIIGAKAEKLCFLNSETGWVTSTSSTDIPLSGRKILKTTNHGQNWTMQYRDSALQNGFSNLDFKVQFINQNIGYGLYHKENSIVKFIKTTNGGTTWDSTSLPYLKYKSMFFADTNTGWICHGFYPDSVSIIRTTNSGTDWQVQKRGNVSLNAIYFVNNLTGWAVGFNGAIMKTVTGGVTGVQNISTEMPSSYSLGQNYPNPFNSMCNVQFTMCNAGQVKLIVYDIQGREVQTLVNEKLGAGTYEVKFDGSMLTSGVYFYRLTTEGFSETKKMILVK